MTLLPYSIATLLAISPIAALAAEPEAMPLTYETFELSVVHLDLETCPEALLAEGVLCRATLANDEIHVFAFAESGAMPLLAYRAYPAGPISSALQ